MTMMFYDTLYAMQNQIKLFLTMHYVKKMTEIPSTQFFDALCTSKPQQIENKERTGISTQNRHG